MESNKRNSINEERLFKLILLFHHSHRERRSIAVITKLLSVRNGEMHFILERLQICRDNTLIRFT